MNTAIDFDGQIVKAENLLRLSDAQKEYGYSRQSLLLWSKGEGRGKDEPLKLLRLFGGLPHIDKEYFVGWLWRTKDDGNHTNELAALRRRNTANKKWLSRLEDVDEDQIIVHGMTKRDLRGQVRSEEEYIAKAEADLEPARDAKNSPAHVETTISYPADDAPEPEGSEVTTKDEMMMKIVEALNDLKAEVAELKQAKK